MNKSGNENLVGSEEKKTLKNSYFDGLVQGLQEASSFIHTCKFKGGKIHITSAIDAIAIRAEEEITMH